MKNAAIHAIEKNPAMELETLIEKVERVAKRKWGWRNHGPYPRSTYLRYMLSKRIKDKR